MRRWPAATPESGCRCGEPRGAPAGLCRRYPPPAPSPGVRCWPGVVRGVAEYRSRRLPRAVVAGGSAGRPVRLPPFLPPCSFVIALHQEALCCWWGRMAVPVVGGPGWSRGAGSCPRDLFQQCPALPTAFPVRGVDAIRQWEPGCGRRALARYSALMVQASAVPAGIQSCGSAGSCSRLASTRPPATAATTAAAPRWMGRKSLENGCSWRHRRGGVRSASICATFPW